jgi:hypothetical protein
MQLISGRHVPLATGPAASPDFESSSVTFVQDRRIRGRLDVGMSGFGQLSKIGSTMRRTVAEAALSTDFSVARLTFLSVLRSNQYIPAGTFWVAAAYF